MLRKLLLSPILCLILIVGFTVLYLAAGQVLRTLDKPDSLAVKELGLGY